MAHIDESELADESSDDDVTDEEIGTAEPFAVPLAELLISDDYPAFGRPAELYDALVEGDISAFVRLPSSFDCCVPLSATYWRGVDAACFGDAFGDRPYRSRDTYRASSQDVLKRVTSAVEGGFFAQWMDMDDHPNALLYAVGVDDQFGSYTSESPPPSEMLKKRLENDILRDLGSFFNPIGYVVFVVQSDVVEYRRNRSQRLDQEVGKRGYDWATIFAAGLAYILESQPQKVLAGEIIERLKRAGVKTIPTEGTVIKELSMQTKKYR